jgi:hypothetical protein
MNADAYSQLRQLSARLGLAFETQDWEIINADPHRLDEFIGYYEANPHDSIYNHHALMELILASANELMAQKGTADFDALKEFLERHRDRATFSVPYWYRLRNPEEFPIGAWLRSWWTK